MRHMMAILTIVVWFLVTIVLAYFYVTSRVSSPDAIPGYETQWRFQLVSFAVFRLPLLVALLIAVLWAERRLLRQQPSPRQ